MTQYQQVFYECESCGHRRYSLDTISFSYFPNDSQKAQDAINKKLFDGISNDELEPLFEDLTPLPSGVKCTVCEGISYKIIKKFKLETISRTEHRDILEAQSLKVNYPRHMNVTFSGKNLEQALRGMLELAFKDDFRKFRFSICSEPKATERFIQRYQNVREAYDRQTGEHRTKFASLMAILMVFENGHAVSFNNDVQEEYRSVLKKNPSISECRFLIHNLPPKRDAALKELLGFLSPFFDYPNREGFRTQWIWVALNGREGGLSPRLRSNFKKRAEAILEKYGSPFTRGLLSEEISEKVSMKDFREALSISIEETNHLQVSPSYNYECFHFLIGKGHDASGRMLEEIKQFSDAQIESTHDFIQWLFPLDEPSSAVPNSPVLSIEEITIIGASENAVASLISSSEWFLGFLQRNKNWFSAYDHNHLRITRVIKSLYLLAGLHAAENFRQKVLSLCHGNDEKLSNSKKFWTEAVLQPNVVFESDGKRWVMFKDRKTEEINYVTELGDYRAHGHKFGLDLTPDKHNEKKHSQIVDKVYRIIVTQVTSSGICYELVEELPANGEGAVNPEGLKHCSPLTEEQIESARDNQKKLRALRNIDVIPFGCFSFFDQAHIDDAKRVSPDFKNVLVLE